MDQEIKFLFNYFETYREYLNSLQLTFIASIKGNYYATQFLTKSQVDYLYQIKEHISSALLKETANESESEKYQAQYSSYDCLTTYTRV